MARAKSGSRNITVAGVAYRWRARRHEASMSLVVWPVGYSNSLMTARFEYEKMPNLVRSERARYDYGGPLVITNRLVRRVIELACAEHQYHPAGKGRPIELGNIESRIEMTDAIIPNNKWW